jgi:Family of unknown function (DUF5681)
VSESDDSAGYKRPPQSSRFKAGRSGNPKGRPKGGRNLKTDLTALMKKRIPIREDGELRQVSGQEAILLSLFGKAVRGDLKASAQIITMLMKIDNRDPAPPEPAAVTDNDRAIVEDFLRRNAVFIREENES